MTSGRGGKTKITPIASHVVRILKIIHKSPNTIVNPLRTVVDSLRNASFWIPMTPSVSRDSQPESVGGAHGFMLRPRQVFT